MIKMTAFRRSMLMLAVTAVVGCASTPNVTTSYYLPRAVTQIQVIQSFMCPVSAASQELSVTAAVTAATSYIADYAMDPQVVDFGGYRTPFADTDIAVTRSADKRLLGINSTSAGEGSTILQDVISLGSAIASVATVAAKRVGNAPPPAAAGTSPCSIVRAHYMGDPKNPPTLSLTYSASIVYGDPVELSAKKTKPTALPIGIDPATTTTAAGTDVKFAQSLTLTADPASAQLQADLRKTLPATPDPFAFQLKSVDAYGLADDASWADAPPTLPKTNAPTPAKPMHGVLILNRVFNTDLELTGAVLSPSGTRSASLWRAAVAVPIHDTYLLPLPTPALFGKTAFTLTLADSGIVTKLEYSTTGGAGDAISTATALVKAIQPSSAETKATDTQGKADQIYEQQRLTICKASPSSCPSK